MDKIQEDLIEYLHSRAFLPNGGTLRPNESLTSAGVIDSIGLIQLIDYLEEKYNLEVPLEFITPDNFDTLEGIERTIRQLSA
ncbi:MAG: phosphopantetheine-binding protein [Methanomicrobiales archaeon]|nr:phosphopantetheine-binding protein [Methanomicrobiales archaeon]